MAARSGLKHLIRTAGQRPTALSPSNAVALRSAAPVVLSHHHAPVVTPGLVEESVRWANLKAISDRMRSVG